MGQFLGTHQNRLDSKGRVSIPAPFRAYLRELHKEGEHQLVLRPSNKTASIEGWPGVSFREFENRVDSYDIDDDEQAALLLTLFANAVPVESDREGRIILPEQLIAHANLTDTVSFVGLSRRFDIWEPNALAARQEAVARARRNKQAMEDAAREPVE